MHGVVKNQPSFNSWVRVGRARGLQRQGPGIEEPLRSARLSSAERRDPQGPGVASHYSHQDSARVELAAPPGM